MTKRDVRFIANLLGYIIATSIGIGLTKLYLTNPITNREDIIWGTAFMIFFATVFFCIGTFVGDD